MTRALAAKGVVIGSCGTCLEVRGITDDLLLAGVHRSSMTELAAWTTWANQTINV